jgi:hypothetical protein
MAKMTILKNSGGQVFMAGKKIRLMEGCNNSCKGVELGFKDRDEITTAFIPTTMIQQISIENVAKNYLIEKGKMIEYLECKDLYMFLNLGNLDASKDRESLLKLKDFLVKDKNLYCITTISTLIDGDNNIKENRLTINVDWNRFNSKINNFQSGKENLSNGETLLAVRINKDEDIDDLMDELFSSKAN